MYLLPASMLVLRMTRDIRNQDALGMLVGARVSFLQAHSGQSKEMHAWRGYLLLGPESLIFLVVQAQI